jgi:hypothetical protein
VADKLRPAESDVKQMTTRCCGRVGWKHNLKRKYSRNQRFSLDQGSEIPKSSPPLFHGFPAGYPQFFAQALEGKSAGNQRDFHMFCTRFPYNIRVHFFRSFYDAIPKEIADSAGKKNGVNEAWDGLLRKNGASWSLGAVFGAL